jgi:hypothetical protein
MREIKRTYSLPAGIIDPDTLRKDAARRRQALRDAGCSTYVIGVRGGAPGIVCLCCGLGSSNAGDIKERYCGFCKEFHDEMREEEQL